MHCIIRLHVSLAIGLSNPLMLKCIQCGPVISSRRSARRFLFHQRVRICILRLYENSGRDYSAHPFFFQWWNFLIMDAGKRLENSICCLIVTHHPFPASHVDIIIQCACGLVLVHVETNAHWTIATQLTNYTKDFSIPSESHVGLMHFQVCICLCFGLLDGRPRPCGRLA
jgi:hypothetical protein